MSFVHNDIRAYIMQLNVSREKRLKRNNKEIEVPNFYFKLESFNANE